MKYGEALKFIRNSLGITQTELAKNIEWTQSAVSECEKSGRIPSAIKHQKVENFSKKNKIKIDWHKILDDSK